MKVEGQAQLRENFRKLNIQIAEASYEGLAKAGMKIVADAQRNLRANRTNNTGVLSSTGRVIKVDDETVDVGFFADENSVTHRTNYAEYVEYGRRAGKMPPFYAIYQWVRKKLRKKDDEAKSIARVIQISIGKKGTQPHPFFEPAVKNNENEVEKAVMTATGKVLE